MQAAYFNSFCPFELKDRVTIDTEVKKEKHISGEVFTVYDILAVHSLRQHDVVFFIILKDEYNRIIGQPIRDTYLKMVK